MLLFWTTLACAAPPVQAPGDAPALTGTAVSIAVPTLTKVVAQDGTARDRSALLGQPTALWFYPAAGTPG